ncbi:MAG TPA: DUF1080 domain-containing protein, partial [Panacibacter sp.]|nr:DUF1080 domain-containing protein [Panacibacter sp.]
MKQTQVIHRISIVMQVVIILLAAVTANAKNKNFYFKPAAAPPLEGRWDITVDEDGKKVPSWLEVHHSGLHTLVGQFVGSGGSARPISKINFTDGKMSFAIPPQWDESDNDLRVEGILENDHLSGTMTTPTGKTYNWTAVRAPSLKRQQEPVWGKPVKLLNDNNLDGWHALGKANQWVVESGVLKSAHPGANLVTDKTFGDFKLHIEFRYPKESNSGVYLRGRYEIQIAGTKGMEPSKDELGAIYGFIAPSDMMAKEPEEWQSYDVILIGRTVT